MNKYSVMDNVILLLYLLGVITIGQVNGNTLPELRKELQNLKEDIDHLKVEVLVNIKKGKQVEVAKEESPYRCPNSGKLKNQEERLLEIEKEKEDFNVEVEKWNNKTSELEKENEMLKNNHQEILHKNQEEIKQLKERLLAFEKEKEDFKENFTRDVDRLTKEKNDINSQAANLRKDVDRLKKVKEEFNNDRCPSGWKFFPKAASCYLVILGALNNTKAQETCLEYGGQLASVHSKEENEFVTDAVPIKGKYYSWFWIGMKRNEKNINEWINIDETKANYTNWATGEPNNVANNENCVNANYAEIGKWNDIRCSFETIAVCKKPAEKA